MKMYNTKIKVGNTVKLTNLVFPYHMFSGMEADVVGPLDLYKGVDKDNKPIDVFGYNVILSNGGKYYIHPNNLIDLGPLSYRGTLDAKVRWDDCSWKPWSDTGHNPYNTK